MEKKTLLISILFLLLSVPSAQAQRPCRDTTVHFSDSVCEGSVYHWAGRDLDHTGVFYDTLQRALDTCDSVNILHLFVLEPLDLEIARAFRCTSQPGSSVPAPCYLLLSSYSGSCQQWSSSPPDPTFQLGSTPYFASCSPSQPTVYTLHADYAPSPTCPDSASITINPIQPVQASLTVSPSSIDYEHPVITLHDGSHGNREAPYGGWYGRNWFINGERLPQWQSDITLSLSDPYPDTLHILMQAYSPTCADSDSAIVIVNKDLISIPNIFTPDADNNNRFLPHIQNLAQYHLYIYNRYGRLIFNTDNPTLPWDGTLQGTPLPQGTYNYRILYSHTFAPLELHTRTGTLTLLR